MANRKALSKKTRFEVFKRDSFTCQYCGSAAPDVVLQVDHIKPVALGGANSITNLITSCVDCNSGKGKRELSDESAAKKAKAQADQLQERRSQLEMMAEWRSALIGLEEQAADLCCREFFDRTGYTLLDGAKKQMKRLCRRYGLPEVLESIKDSIDIYFGDGSDNESKRDMRADLAANKIEGVCKGRALRKNDPARAEAVWAVNILKKNLSLRFPPHGSIAKVSAAINLGADPESIKRAAATAGYIDQFMEEVDALTPARAEL